MSADLVTLNLILDLQSEIMRLRGLASQQAARIRELEGATTLPTTLPATNGATDAVPVPD